MAHKQQTCICASNASKPSGRLDQGVHACCGSGGFATSKRSTSCIEMPSASGFDVCDLTLQVVFSTDEARFFSLDTRGGLCCWVSQDCSQLFSVNFEAPRLPRQSLWRTCLLPSDSLSPSQPHLGAESSVRSSLSSSSESTILFAQAQCAVPMLLKCGVRIVSLTT